MYYINQEKRKILHSIQEILWRVCINIHQSRLESLVFFFVVSLISTFLYEVLEKNVKFVEKKGVIGVPEKSIFNGIKWISLLIKKNAKHKTTALLPTIKDHDFKTRTQKFTLIYGSIQINFIFI